MYSSTDLSIIYNPYFTVLHLSDDCCELQSNNTGHQWFITQTTDGYYTLYHRHHPEDPYHHQYTSLTIEDLLLEAVNHDEFQLRGRKPLRYKPKESFFDTIVRAYQGI